MKYRGGGKLFSLCPWFRHIVISAFRDFDFGSAQYLENKLMEFDKILYMHWYWQDLGWDC